MKFQRTPQFKNDYKNDLNEAGRKNWDDAFPDIVKALEGDSGLFQHFRIKKMQGWAGRQRIWEGHIKQNICFTFHYDYTDEGEKICFFRRIGTHEIYDRP